MGFLLARSLDSIITLSHRTVMDGGEKRKRVRKRPNRSSNATEDVQQEANTTPAASVDKDVHEEAGPSRRVEAKEPSKPAQAATAGPTLSFYQRTNPHKPSVLSSLSGGAARRYTVSVALPGSIVLNAQTPELQARLAGQIARSCAIFNIDEIVIFDEGKQDENLADRGHRGGQYGAKRRWNEEEEEGEGYAQEDGNTFEEKKRSAFDPNAFLARILQYVETPQYLRKALFPMHRDLRLAGLLAPLDCPHHLRFEDQSPYREGVCVEAPHWARQDRRSAAPSCWVDVGLRDPIACPSKAGANVPVGARVTVKLPSSARSNEAGKLVSPREPVEQRGTYWGYTVRLCNSLAEAISNPTWSVPYDFVIGTSERGVSLSELTNEVQHKAADGQKASTTNLPASFKHALIVFGGLSGLEVAVERDPNINATADEASELFDAWVNVVENQGSRTIRTEEALLIALARLKTVTESLGAK